MTAAARHGRASRILLLLALAAAAGCTVNPVTGERELSLISEQQAISMGKESAAQVEQTVGLVPDQGLQSYVASVGHKLAADTERPDLPWEFHVVDDPSPNAFALPGGFIFVTRGLIDLMTSEAELAGVLGHEIGHVTAKHSVVQLSRQQIAQLGLGLGAVLSPQIAQLSQLANQGLDLLFLKYSRDDERQADALGFKYMVNEGYDPKQMTDVFQALEQSSKLAGASPLPGWLSSHPSDPERIASAKARVAALPEAKQNGNVGRDAYVPHLDGLVYGKDPREGFFRGDWFYQPELSLRIAVPSDWQRQNLKQSVEAVSPKQDAAARLAISKAATPEAAVQAFLAQQGVRGLASQRQNLDGNPAIVTEFQAAIQNGTVAGYVAYISHGQATYELLAYAPSAAFDQQQLLLQRIVTSFATVRDKDILNVRAQHIGIVKLPSAMSLEEFARRYPSSIKLDELALLNQMNDTKAPIPAGTLLKRVTGGPAG
ncbi:MAG TPA: M48 family metalloprotease [Gammaproteobacteria bacterium]|nr:M48 family metalloprotease [Gammaproteobacteria bacterium]